jgi:ribose 5-phosphate isomerase A
MLARAVRSSAAAVTASVVYMSTVAAAEATKHALPPIERAKREAAFRAVDANVKSGMVVGVGSGSTVVYAVERLGSKFASGALADLQCVPTSFQARQLILEHRLPLSDLERTPKVRGVRRWIRQRCGRLQQPAA